MPAPRAIQNWRDHASPKEKEQWKRNIGKALRKRHRRRMRAKALTGGNSFEVRGPIMVINVRQQGNADVRSYIKKSSRTLRIIGSRWTVDGLIQALMDWSKENKGPLTPTKRTTYTVEF